MGKAQKIGSTHSQLNAQTVPTYGERYVDVVIPVTMSTNTPLVGNAGVFNGFFRPNQTETTTNMQVFDWRKSSIPTNAKVTKVEVSSIKTNVPDYGSGATIKSANFKSIL